MAYHVTHPWLVQSIPASLPVTGGRDNILHTSLAIDTASVFVGYRHCSEVSSDVTFNVKDLRSVVTLCEHQGSNVTLR